MSFKKKIWSILTSEEMSILPGQIAFFMVLSLIPVITLITYVGTLLLPSLHNMIQFMNEYFPNNVNELLLPILYNTDFKFGFGLFLVTSFLIASNGINSIIIAADNLYKIKPNNVLYRRIKALFILILLVIMIIFILLVPVFGSRIITLLSSLNIINNLSDTVHNIYYFLKWPLTIFYIYFTVNLIYVLVPSKTVKSREVSRGSLFTTVSWVIITFLFSTYINNIATYQLFYGSLANIIILMLWIYLLSFIFVLGLMLNVERAKTRSVKSNQ